MADAEKPARPHKFNATRTTIDGVTFPSKAEAERWVVLCQRERAGEVRNLRRQGALPLVVEGVRIATYIADFEYEELRDEGWFSVTEDTKGVRTPVYQLKKKLVKVLYGIDIYESGRPRPRRKPRCSKK